MSKLVIPKHSVDISESRGLCLKLVKCKGNSTHEISLDFNILPGYRHSLYTDKSSLCPFPGW